MNKYRRVECQGATVVEIRCRVGNTPELRCDELLIHLLAGAVKRFFQVMAHVVPLEIGKHTDIDSAVSVFFEVHGSVTEIDCIENVGCRIFCHFRKAVTQYGALCSHHRSVAVSTAAVPESPESFACILIPMHLPWRILSRDKNFERGHLTDLYFIDDTVAIVIHALADNFHRLHAMMKHHRALTKAAHRKELTLAAERTHDEVVVNTRNMTRVHRSRLVRNDRPEMDTFSLQLNDLTRVIDGPLPQLLQPPGHFPADLLHTAVTKHRHWIYQPAIEAGESLVRGIFDVNRPGHEHGGIVESAGTADPGNKRRRRRADYPVTIETGLGVESIDSQEGAVVL